MPAASVEPLESRRLFAAAEPIVGIGVLGDSFADEYQFYPPDRSTARNFVEQLAEDRALNFGPFDADGAARGEPRNAGFAFNWAKDGATTIATSTANANLICDGTASSPKPGSSMIIAPTRPNTSAVDQMSTP